jgi:hypothetical protein
MEGTACRVLRVEGGRLPEQCSSDQQRALLDAFWIGLGPFEERQQLDADEAHGMRYGSGGVAAFEEWL